MDCASTDLYCELVLADDVCDMYRHDLVTEWIRIAKFMATITAAVA